MDTKLEELHFRWIERAADQIEAQADAPNPYTLAFLAAQLRRDLAALRRDRDRLAGQLAEAVRCGCGALATDTHSGDAFCPKCSHDVLEEQAERDRALSDLPEDDWREDR